MFVRTMRPAAATSKVNVIAGVVLELGSPVSREVRVYSRHNGALLATKKSDMQGKYKFYLPFDAAYTIVSIDPKRIFNAVIQDNVVPK
ncbi:hypothetical protein MJ004_13075 [Acinetobacter junii]|uniref:hypothetical protein n=1 Tax=Acinetobacter junii TaxID=40215 RepID=UPI0022EA3F7E|nr:hypothetical protein [Acinetobacter junii]MDA3509324.1 hypothetical protein [Acinetobacter junii]MDA3533623.1 hypothetical protein [Acinetobacter junii]